MPTIEDTKVSQDGGGAYVANATVRGAEVGVPAVRAWATTRPGLPASAAVTVTPPNPGFPS